jgi:60 kDa SS-A/Ro ribonucleoprotein
MATVNTKRRTRVRTHEGAPAQSINAELQLRRSVMACFLWEKEFYEDGKDIASRIQALVKKVDPKIVAAIAIEARTQMKLRHAPLLLVRELARNTGGMQWPIGSIVSETLANVIQRPDELTEFLAIYWKDGRQPLSAQVKKGLAAAFRKFDPYQLAKYNREGTVRLRDVLFLSHAKPVSNEQAITWKQLVEDRLPLPGTWEERLSAGEDPKTVFTDLIQTEKLGAFALIRNLRNMEKAGVSKTLVNKALADANISRILPFRFISAARHAPRYEPQLEQLLFKAAAEQPKLDGSNAILIDVSGSMDSRVPGRSEISRSDAANALAIIAREMCEEVDIYIFGESCKMIPPRRGFGLSEAIQQHSNSVGWSTYIGKAVKYVQEKHRYDRVITISDEQSWDSVPQPKGKGYMVNVASAKNGVGYHGTWTHVDGFSEATLKWIREYETL